LAKPLKSAPEAEVPSLSVVIACRNSASTLAETLESLTRQSYGAWWEVLVVDNGSTDATSPVAREFATRLPNLRVLSVPVPGYQARALNYGIEQSTGEVFAFLDSDDLVADGYLEALGRALATAAFVGGRMDIARLNPAGVRNRRRQLQEDGIDVFCGYRPAVIGASMGAQRQQMEKVGGFDESLPTQHDLDISWRLAEAGCEATFVPGAVLHYRYRTGAREFFRQERGYGVGEVVLFRKFRDAGMPSRSALRVLLGYARLMLALLRTPLPGGLARSATALGISVGRLEGSIRHRTLYL
jgi:glycosyltransferase involved in cell wall biosynthesis